MIEEPILEKSQCSTDAKEKAYFKEIMGEKKFKTLLRYRASRDGWFNEDFHRMSDGKGATVSLYKLKENGLCIGGFTSAYWGSPHSRTPVSDSTAMLFNLTTNKVFKCQDHSMAIECYKGYGPVFGNGELGTVQPFNGNNQCWSYAEHSGYRIGIDGENKSDLTNLKYGLGD